MRNSKQFEYKIEEWELKEYDAYQLNQEGKDGWQAVHIEDRKVQGVVYDDDSRKTMGLVEKRFVTFMREIPYNPECDA